MIRTIFLQNNTTFKPLQKKEKVNLILSPSFYWVKIFTIPVENENKALFLVPNLFEDFFDIAGYSFFTIKIDEHKFLSFAYDEEKILEKLQALEIPQNKIEKIFFAQNELKNLFEIENQKILKSGDEIFMLDREILIKVPSNLAITSSNPQEIEIEKIGLSQYFVELFSYKKLTSNKSAQYASSIFLGFAILLFIQTFIYKQMTNEYPSKIEAIKEQYNLPPTLIQANAIVESYGKSQRQYNKIRDAISYAVSANSLKETKIIEIHLEKNILTLYYKVSDLETLESYLKKEFKRASLRNEEGRVKVRIEL